MGLRLTSAFIAYQLEEAVAAGRCTSHDFSGVDWSALVRGAHSYNLLAYANGSQINQHLTCSIGQRGTVAVARLQAAAAQIRGKAGVPREELVSCDSREKRDE